MTRVIVLKDGRRYCGTPWQIVNDMMAFDFSAPLNQQAYMSTALMRASMLSLGTGAGALRARILSGEAGAVEFVDWLVASNLAREEAVS